MTLHVGFTGTRTGCSAAQLTALLEVLDEIDGAVFHHGDCVGADEQAADLAYELGYQLIGHPPTNPRLRAYHPHTRLLMAEEPYMARNQAIVDASAVMVAAVRSGGEFERSGTWATIRMARRADRPIYLTTPGGAVLDGHPKRTARLTENTA